MKNTIIILLLIIVLVACSKGPGRLTPPDLNNKRYVQGITLVITNPILADSLTFGSVTLIIDSPKLYAKYRVATFTISPIGKFSNDSSTTTVQIDNKMQAQTSIFSNVSGIAYVTATVGNITTVNTITFSPASNPLTLSTSTVSIPADNSTYAVINASITNLNILQKSTSITFTTNKGTFANNTTTYTTSISSSSGGNPIATVYLKDNNVELATVTATIPVSGSISYTSNASVNFTTSFPDILSITLTPDSFAKTNITAQLIRNNGGFVTPGQVVYFRDSLAPSGISVGVFSNISPASNSIGVATTLYSIPDTAGLSGQHVYIIGVVDTGGSSIRSMNKVYIP